MPIMIFINSNFIKFFIGETVKFSDIKINTAITVVIPTGEFASPNICLNKLINSKIHINVNVFDIIFFSYL